MKNTPLLSIVIPNYNYARFLEHLLAGLNNLEHRDKIEVIVVDGGSSDSSLDIAKKYLSTHDKLLFGPDDGQADAIAKGLSIATGDWFIFQNSDDLFDFATLNLFLSEANKWAAFSVIAFNQDFLVFSENNWTRKTGFRHSRPVGWRQLSWSIYYTNQATIYKRMNAIDVGFDVSKKFALDYDFVVRYFKKFNPMVLIINQVLGLQRLHEETKTSKMQEICLTETRLIKQCEFTLLDRTIGFFQASLYHLQKKFAHFLWIRK